MGWQRVVWLTCFLALASAAPEQGKFSAVLEMGQDKNIAGFVKTLYRNSTVKLVIEKSECNPAEGDLTLKWVVRSTSCYGEYAAIKGETEKLYTYIRQPEDPHPYGSGEYKLNEGENVRCGAATSLTSYSDRPWIPFPSSPDIDNVTTAKRQKREETNAKETSTTNKETKEDTKQAAESSAVKPTETNDTEKEGSVTLSPSASETHIITKIPHEAPYILVVEVNPSKANVEKFTIKITAEMKTPKGYLSAHEYPLLTFYMIMCIIYSLYAVAWLVMSACNFRDLLRVQFWIGGVILLGMIEKAVFYSEYLSVNSTGESVIGASKFAEVVSAMKRALARMLVIIVSLGFGIVKPRLGPMLHRVIGVGILYFILAVIEALVRVDTAVRDPGSNNLLFASIPLAVLDSVICWWIFMSLMQTMKTLRLRRNVVKLSLYRHFTNTIIFCVIASLIMIFYSFRYRDQCMSDWQELWVDTAFWHILFSVILLVIMILWRPNINNQRYAFSPLIDGDLGEEESQEPMLGAGATETVKMRGLKTSSGRDQSNKAEEDLKWIEENIPQTVADAALPAIMDSDEEVMTTKYEMNKME